MEYRLDREIRLLEETEHKSLYTWFLQEFTKEGTALAPKLIPWAWSLAFRATELKYVRRFETAPDDLSQSGDEFIHATLTPSQRSGERSSTEYSMFGTNRLIHDVSVTIHKLQNEQGPEKCTLWGSVSYTREIDFDYHTEDDLLCFRVDLKPENYDALCYFAKHGGNQDELLLSVKRVSGFYSEWSPAISTDSIKVLAADTEQNVIRSEGFNEPPRLGEISEFTLHFSRRTSLCTQADKEDDAAAKDSSPSSLPAESSSADANAALLQVTHELQTTLKRLRLPIWLIVVLLVLMVLR